MSADAYVQLQSVFRSSPVFAPPIPLSLLPYLSTIFLFLAFVMGFYSTTIKSKGVSAKELAVAALASLFAGFGTVALFASSGVII